MTVRVMVDGPDAPLTFRVLQALEGAQASCSDRPLAVVSTWERADVVILAVGAAGDLTSSLLHRLSRAGLPIVLVAPLTLDLLRAGQGLDPYLAATVWVDELAQRLTDVVCDVGNSLVAKEVQRILLPQASESPILRRAIRELCSGQPPTSVTALAARIRVPYSSFYWHWSSSQLAAVPVKALIDWLALVRAFELRARRPSTWTSVAQQVGVDRRTLERVAVRLCHRTLGQLTLVMVRQGVAAWLQRRLPGETC